MIKHSFDQKKEIPKKVKPVTPRPVIDLKETREKIKEKTKPLRKI